MLVTTTRVLLCALLASFIGCSAEPGEGDDLHAVSPDKTDDYYSDVATEYEVSVTLPVALTADEANDPEVSRDRAVRRATAFGLYFTAYLTAKFEGIDENGDGQISDDERFFYNMGYGDFSAMVRNGTVDDVAVTAAEDGTYRASFTIDVAGPRNLMSRIPPAEGTAESVEELAFDLQMPAGASVDPSNVPRQTFRRFDPSTYEGELETVRCVMRPLPGVGNSFPRFDGFVEDGVFDVTLFYGHDYNSERSDLQGARDAFQSLRSLGFDSPVDTFEDLTADSGPFVRQARADGREILVEARIFHSDMFATARRRQHDLALSEITSRDVFFYNGHAGPYFGFYLDANYEATVSYLEFAEAAFQPNRQQLVIAQGCQTYSNYADMLYAHRDKSEENLDVITSVNYTYGQGTTDILRALLRFDSQGNHQPTDFYRIVGGLNSNWINRSYDVFYGVMGITDNPQIHPYASLEAIGRACEEAGECGDPIGNVCLATEEGGARRCGAVSLSADACPEGTLFRNVASGSTITGGACLAPEAPSPPAPSGDQVFDSTPAASIPDNDPEGVSDTITVEPALTVRELRVEVDVTHTWRGDLVVELERNGQITTLISREGSSEDDLVRTFPVEGFTGSSAAGQWTLRVRDLAARDLGTLNAWRLVVVTGQ